MISTSKRQRFLFLLVPAVVWTAWLAMMIGSDRWSLLAENYFMTITMCVGSFIAGATSEGGGAVAFPVMTLLFGIKPAVARDFSLMIQSVGMTAATLLIICFRVRVEWRAVLWASLGGAAGIVIGMDLIAPLLTAAYIKMFFTSLWLAFAVALFWINRRRDRFVHGRIEKFNGRSAAILVAAGMMGGMVSGLTGSGLDIMTFTLLALFYRVSEKVATPTSVVLMAGNALVGVLYRGGLQHQLDASAVSYWYACVPVVVIGAPLGAYYIRQRTRQFIASLLYVSIIVQFLAALWIVPQTAPLLLFSAATLLVGLLLFAQMAAAGSTRLTVTRPVAARQPAG